MFWHYFWKTSLFGETNRGGRFESLCASVLSGLLLLFFILASLNLRFFRDAKRRKSLVSVFAFAAVWIVGTVAFSVLYPFSADRDFRFAAPALIVICWLTALSASSFASRRWLSLAMFANALVLLFIGGSIGFVLRLDSFR
jgi:ABC-type Na+ efflux pump permease subunit